jgi:fructokinase
MKKPEITSVGEALIDLVSETPSTDLSTALRFVKHAGGAPANVAVGLSMLGVRTSFLGKVGKDQFGKFLRAELNAYGVDTRWLTDDPLHKTRLAFVSLTDQGGRAFDFWEQDPADQHLNRSDMDIDAVCASRIINISAFLLLHPPTRKTALALAAYAMKKGCIVCFDPNIRLSLWTNPREAIRVYKEMIRSTAILRLNNEEAELLTGKKGYRAASKKLLSMGPKLVVITNDKKGCFYATKAVTGSVKGFTVDAVDTTGCGDGFLAGLLSGIIKSKSEPEDLTSEELTGICTTANAVGALVATRRGAIPAMPTAKQVRAFIRRQ